MPRRLRISLAALALAAVPALTVLAPAASSADAAMASTATRLLPAPAPSASLGTRYSGYIVTGGATSPVLGSYITAVASWVQPAATCSAFTSAASFSVGVGNPYALPHAPYSGPLEQAGTDTDCSGGSPVYYGWYATPDFSRVSFGGAVHAGDTMMATASCLATFCYQSLSDQTAGWSASTSQTVSSMPGSAEVNISRLYRNQSLLPLTNFGTVSFSQVSFNGEPIPTSPVSQEIIYNGPGNPLDSISALGYDSSSISSYFSGTWLAAY